MGFFVVYFVGFVFVFVVCFLVVFVLFCFCFVLFLFCLFVFCCLFVPIGDTAISNQYIYICSEVDKTDVS